MKITLLKAIGNVGIVTELKPVISEAFLTVYISGANEGTLTIREHTYVVNNGKVEIPQHEILAGKSSIVFQTNNEQFACGTITRNGRFLSLDNEADKLIVACALALDAQAKQNKELGEQVKAIDRQFRLI